MELNIIYVQCRVPRLGQVQLVHLLIRTSGGEYCYSNHNVAFPESIPIQITVR
jgi:hypothetical protein